jgi:hypothetical protein
VYPHVADTPGPRGIDVSLGPDAGPTFCRVSQGRWREARVVYRSPVIQYILIEAVDSVSD